MTPLERFTALTSTHLEIRDAVAAIEMAWGVGAPISHIAWRVGVSVEVARSCLVELSLLGLVTWCSRTGEAFTEDAIPVLGSVA